MKQVDQVIKIQKESIKGIDRCIMVLNILMVLLFASICFFIYVFGFDEYLYISSGALLILKNVILVYSIYRIRSFVKTIDYALPNEKLMWIHFFNVFVYTVLYIVTGSLFTISH